MKNDRSQSPKVNVCSENNLCRVYTRTGPIRCHVKGRWSWVRICASNIWAVSKENVDFAHPVFGPIIWIANPILDYFHRH